MTLSVEDYYCLWAERRAPALKRATWRNYSAIMERHWLPLIGHLPLEGVTRRDIEHALARIEAGRLSIDTLGTVLTPLQAMFRHALDEDELIQRDPCRGARKALNERRKRALIRPAKAMSLKELAAARSGWLTYIDDPPLRAGFEFLFWTGCRLGEQLALRREDVDWAARRVTIQRTLSRLGGELLDGYPVSSPKGNRPRTITISAECADGLREQAERRMESPWIFAGRRGIPYSSQWCERQFRRVIEAVGLPRHFTPHSIRHSVLTLLARKLDPKTVSYIAGHASVGFTLDNYVTPDDVDFGHDLGDLLAGPNPASKCK